MNQLHCRAPAPSFGVLLATFRGRAGTREGKRLSQSELAERAGFDHSYVSRLECGIRMPSFETVLDLAAALELSEADTDRLLIAAHFPPNSRRMQALLAAVWAGSWPEALTALAAAMDARGGAA